MSVDEKNQIITVEPFTLQYVAGRGYASFDVSMPDGRSKLHRALHGTRQTLKKSVGVVIAVQDIVVYPRQLTDDNGEIRDYVEIVLIAHDGTQFSTGSPIVARAMLDWIELAGQPPWTPSHNFRVIERESGRGYKMLTLESVGA